MDTNSMALATQLAAIAADPTLATAVSRHRVPALLLLLSSVQTALAALLASSADCSSAAPAEEMLSVEEAARRARCSTSHLYRIWSTIPGAGKSGRRLVFPASSLAHIVRRPGP